MIKFRNAILQLVIIIILMGFCLNSRADSLTPPSLPDFTIPPSSSKTFFNPKLIFGSETFEFGEATLEEIKKTAGVGKIQKHGDAAGTQTWLCYQVDSGSLYKIWLIAGELSGPNMILQSVSAKLISKSERSSETCPVLPKNLKPIIFDKPLWLGTTRLSAQHQLGKPIIIKKDWHIYSYNQSLPLDFEKLSTIYLKFKNDKITELYISQVRTN